MDRRPHPLHLRQHGGNSNNGSGGSQQNGTNHTKENGTANIGVKSDGYRLFQAFLFAQIYRHQRMSCTRQGVKTEHFTVRTTHAHFSRARDTSSTHMRWLKMRGAFGSAFLKSHLVVVSQILLFSFLPRWSRNQTQPASIHGVVHCLTEWLSRVPLQVEEGLGMDFRWE